ncbi:DUF3239 domain-containing protein [Lishizhenia sp.]|uniref:DUF3239 domain-containing protein n=1 Tax=Lishizhenia sp. TaxID=2497594 RepID=UPI00299ECAD8|nr:DUF3239 domain-containing protein [Lishizhenia sp.]MDX1447299.1 DUF3239 domain-containing protein [Lishizhenia sp.]
MKKNFTVDNNTRASNPGNASLNPFVWIYHDTQKILVQTSILLFSIFLTIQVSFWLIPLVILSLFSNGFYWLHKKEHFRSGDSNGGIVISVRPTLVAVATDLTQGFGHYPAIKIIKCNSLKNVKINDKIATVALYSQSKNPNVPHWVGFNPIPLSFATKDQEVLDKAIKSYDMDQWESIKSRLEELDKPYRPGLFKTEIETSDWKSITK